MSKPHGQRVVASKARLVCRMHSPVCSSFIAPDYGRLAQVCRSVLVGPGRAGKLEVRMIVRNKHQRASTDLLSEIVFLLLTAGPWIALMWLLWPRR